MKYNILIAAVLMALISGCTKKHTEVVDCPAQPCTMEFRSITVQFKSKDGSVITVKDYAVINQRTKQTLSDNRGINPAGYYTVVDDSMLRKVSTNGDELTVKGTHPTTGQTKTASLKISGGCNCHVARISGPETITFD